MSFKTNKWMPVFTSLGLCLLTAGCFGGGSDAPELGLVSGTVTLDGKPLAKATVNFEPTTGATSLGMTDETGHYELSYNKDHKGAVPGSHKVRISKFGEPGSPNDTTDQVPAKYNKNSKETAQVKKGENEINFDLKSKRKAKR